MPTLRELTETIQRRPGVREVVILATDGLVIDTHDDPERANADALAARAPAVATAANQLGAVAGGGAAQLILLELDHGYGVLLRLSAQAMLLVSAAPEVALGELLFDLRRHRALMAELV